MRDPTICPNGKGNSSLYFLCISLQKVKKNLVTLLKHEKFIAFCAKTFTIPNKRLLEIYCIWMKLLYILLSYLKVESISLSHHPPWLARMTSARIQHSDLSFMRCVPKLEWILWPPIRVSGLNYWELVISIMNLVGTLLHWTLAICWLRHFYYFY